MSSKGIEDRVARAKRFKAAGANNTEIAEVLGVSPKTVRYYLARKPPKVRGETSTMTRSKERKARAIVLCKEGFDAAYIAKQIGVTCETIWKYTRDLNTRRQPRPKTMPAVKKKPEPMQLRHSDAGCGVYGFDGGLNLPHWGIL